MDCSEDFIYSTHVTLYAEPAAGSAFTHWNGDCAGQPRYCTIGMTTDRSVTANFLSDIDGDGLADVAETNIGIYVSADDTGTDPL